MKVGDLVRSIDGGTDFTYGIILKTDVNLWGEEVVPSGISILWCEGETEIVRRGQWNLLGSFAGFETRDEAELFKTTKMGG